MADLVSRNLSSATKAVVVAFTNDPDRMKMCEEERVFLAAALRAAADQLGESRAPGAEFEDLYPRIIEVPDLLAIADELEAQ